MICAVCVAFSSAADSTFAASSFKKAKVGSVKAVVVSDRTVKVSWKKTPGASGYEVYYSKTKRGAYKKGATVKASTNNAKVKNLIYGKKYYFKVRAFKNKASRKIYSKYSKRIKCIIGPAPPNVTARAVEPTTSKIKISFKKSKRASGYEIWCSTIRSGKYRKIAVLKASRTTYVDNKLKANKRYYYKVRPFDKNKVRGGYSSVVSEPAGGNSSAFDLKKVKYTGGKLKGKKILFLGSSVTYGYSSGGVSFVDYLAKKDGVIKDKSAINGTTISTVKKNSYIDRLRKVKYDSGRKLVVCQLSSNDARFKVPVKIENGKEESLTAFDEAGPVIDEAGPAFDDLDELAKHTGTVRGAIDYIIAYSGQKLGCDVVFYVMPPFKTTGNYDAGFYSKMRDALYESRDFWNKAGYRVYILDMQDTKTYPEFKDFRKYNEYRAFYMKDSVHPTRAGYYRKFLPVFERFLTNKVKW